MAIVVEVADDGQQALELFEAKPFDVILMDVEMPRLDGLDATGRFAHRETDTGKHIPIIAMTAHAMKGDRERCLEAGMDDYIAKPIRGEHLIRGAAQGAQGLSPSARSVTLHGGTESVAGQSCSHRSC